MQSKKKIFLLMLFLIVLVPFFLSGCGGGVQVKQTPIQSNDKVSFVVPNNGNIVGDNSYLSGLRYSSTYQQIPIYINGQYSYSKVRGIKYDIVNNIMTVADFYGNEVYASSIKYYVMIKKNSQKNVTILTLIPYKKITDHVTTPLGVSISIPNFTEYQLMSFLKSTSLTVKFKTSDNSKYNSFSVNANFVRLLKQEQLKKEVKITGRIFKMAYILPLMNNQYQAKLFVSVYPYQNGSMAVVHVVMPIKVESNSNVTDLTFINNLISRAKQKIKEIVQS